jgi:hypothetical protein
MKRLRFIVLVGAIAAAMAVPVVAKATGSTGAASQVTIQEKVDYDFAGAQLDVGLYVRCSGGSGSVIVDVKQYPPETPYPVGAGSGPQIVACDGKTHTVGVTITGFGFDAGRALATANLTAPSGNVETSRWVNIVVV